MSINILLDQMCAELSDADLNAIRKARGFSPGETASRTAFASFFVSSIGVAEAVQALSAEEIVTLHLLHQTGEADISFFERLYGSEARGVKYYYGTYTQRYKPTLDAVKKNLVRRGLLVMAEGKVRADTVQMQRWRFVFPPEFAPYLPPVLPARTHHESGQTSDHAVREKLLQLVGPAPASPKDRTLIQIREGTLWLDDQPFSTDTLQAWQARAWWSSLNVLAPPVQASLSLTEAVIRLLGSLGPNEWVRPQDLDPAIRIYCFGGKILPAEKILHQGWELGLVSRLNVDSASLYRPAPRPAPGEPDLTLPASVSWIESSPKTDFILVDLQQVPPHFLALLNLLTHLSIEKDSLRAAPSRIKLGRAAPQQRNSPLSLWLAEHVPAFGNALALVNERWGRTILHENLLIARVRDLNLRVQLERELGGNLIILSDSFIAFPQDSRSSVDKILKKTGFVEKIIEP